MATYGFGPIGHGGLAKRTGLVLTEWLTLEQVDVREPSNFWVGPSARDLVHLGAKFSPCMRRDDVIAEAVGRDERLEAVESGCCVKNDGSGCVTTSKEKCSPFLSVFHKWSEAAAGPEGRVYGPVCGQDPRYCLTGHGAARWPDDLSQWPVCKASVSVRDEAPEHMR